MNIKKLINKIKNNNFMKSVLTLVSGIIIAQGINFAGMPFIGRVYEPSAIGDYTLVTANSAIIMSVACLGMMTVFLLPKSDEEARGLSKLVTGSTIIISTIAVGILFLCADIFKIFTTEDVSYGISLLVLWGYITLYTINNICYAYSNRRKLYKIMFWNPIIGASANIILGILFGVLGWGFIGYTLAHITGFVLNIFHLIRYANPYEKVTNKDWKWKPLLKEYSRFPKYQMPANLISSLSAQMPVQMLGVVFGGTILGMYAMCMKILALPAVLLATPINRVYFKEASDRYNNGLEIGEFTYKILKANIKIALIPILILTIFGEQIFILFLGENWGLAGEFASILGIYELLIFCVRAVSGGLVILGKNKLNLYLSIGSIVINSGIFILAATLLQEEPLIVVWAVSISGMLVQAVTLGVFLKFANFKLKKYIGFLGIYIFIPYALAYLIRIIIF